MSDDDSDQAAIEGLDEEPLPLAVAVAYAGQERQRADEPFDAKKGYSRNNHIDSDDANVASRPPPRRHS